MSIKKHDYGRQARPFNEEDVDNEDDDGGFSYGGVSGVPFTFGGVSAEDGTRIGIGGAACAGASAATTGEEEVVDDLQTAFGSMSMWS